MDNIQKFIKKIVTKNPVVLFMKGTEMLPKCRFSEQAVQILRKAGIKNLLTINVLENEKLRQGIKKYANWPTIPQLYILGEFIGGVDIINKLNETGNLPKLVEISSKF